MNDNIVKLIKESVWDKLVEIDENDFDKHVNRECANKLYPISVISAKVGDETKYFAYDVKEPPNFSLLEINYRKTKQIYGNKEALKS